MGTAAGGTSSACSSNHESAEANSRSSTGSPIGNHGLCEFCDFAELDAMVNVTGVLQAEVAPELSNARIQTR